MLTGLWGYIASGVIAIAGVLWGIFKHQQAATATAKAQTATEDAANAKADAAASKQALATVQAAATDRSKIDATVQTTTGSDLDKAIKDGGFVG